MTNELKLSNTEKIVLSPLIIIIGEDDREIFFKKGNREVLLEFEGADQTKLVVNVLEKTKTPISITELIKNLNITISQHIFVQLIEKLLELKILLKIDISDISNLVFNGHFDNALDNFFWEKEVEWPNFVKYKNHFSVRIIGNNQLSFILKRLLKNFGFSDIVIVNYPYLSDSSLNKSNKDIINLEDFLSFDNKVSTFNIIADAYGNIPALIQLNRMFLDQEIPFLSLCVLSQIGYVGPFVVPKKTSCLHCFLSKLEQTQGILNVTNASESEVFRWKKSLYPHPSVIESLAHFFTFQLFSHIRGLLVKKEKSIEKNSIFYDNYCNNVTEFDLINSNIVNRFFLKNNNCPSCCDLKIRQKIVFNFRNNDSL